MRGRVWNTKPALRLVYLTDPTRIKLLRYSDRRSYGCVFEKLTCHALWYANATMRCSKRWNISLVHRVTAPEEHRVRHPRAIEMGSFRLVVLT